MAADTWVFMRKANKQCNKIVCTNTKAFICLFCNRLKLSVSVSARFFIRYIFPLLANYSSVQLRVGLCRSNFNNDFYLTVFVSVTKPIVGRQNHDVSTYIQLVTNSVHHFDCRMRPAFIKPFVGRQNHDDNTYIQLIIYTVFCHHFDCRMRLAFTKPFVGVSFVTFSFRLLPVDIPVLHHTCDVACNMKTALVTNVSANILEFIRKFTVLFCSIIICLYNNNFCCYSFLCVARTRLQTSHVETRVLTTLISTDTRPCFSSRNKTFPFRRAQRCGAAILRCRTCLLPFNFNNKRFNCEYFRLQLFTISRNPTIASFLHKPLDGVGNIRFCFYTVSIPDRRVNSEFLAN